MLLVPGSERVVADANADPVSGTVRWSPAKWIGGMTLATLAAGPFTLSWDAFALFIITTGVTLLFGHSVGLHRRLIHNSFECPLWLEYLCVYLSTLVGMAGPIGMIGVHDFRDWAQRQPDCHDYFCHRRSFSCDAWWQLHCELRLAHPPRFQVEQRLAGDRFYAFVERSWMAQQIPWAMLFFAIGGIGWVVWGICARVAVSVTGHWLVGHFAHRQGGQSFVVDGAGVQGYNVTLAGLISMGESWHNNHHAFPGSAKLGLFPGEIDLGWWLIKGFEAFGLASRIGTPADLPYRPELQKLPDSDSGWPFCRVLRLAFG